MVSKLPIDKAADAVENYFNCKDSSSHEFVVGIMAYPGDTQELMFDVSVGIINLVADRGRRNMYPPGSKMEKNSVIAHRMIE